MAQESRLAIVVDSSQARPSTENLTRAMRALDDAGVRVTGTTANVGAEMDRMAGQSNAAAAAIRRGLIAALGSLSVMRVIDTADEWGQYASRIRMATKSVEEYEAAQNRMLQSANETYRSINETREAFILMSPVIRSMGASLETSMDVVDAFSGLLVVNAASADRAANAMRALTLSMQKGKMDVLNWMTISSTMPSLIDEIAEHTGKSTEEIRKMGAQGKLSISMLVDALGGRYEAIMKKVADMPTTVRDAMTNVANAFGEYVGKHNEANQITATLAASIEVLGKNIDTVLNFAIVASVAGLGRYAVGMALASAQTAIKGLQARKAAVEELALARAQAVQTEATLAQISAFRGVVTSHAQVTAATLANEAAQKRLAAAQAATTVAGRSLLSLLTGPVGIAISVGLAATALFDMGGAANAAAVDLDALKGSAEEASKAFAKLGTLSRQAAIESMKALHSDQTKEASKAWHDFVNKLEPTTAKGAKAVAEMRNSMRADVKAIRDDTTLSLKEIERALSDLIEKWIELGIVTKEQAKSYLAAGAEATSLQGKMNQTGQRMDELIVKHAELEEAAKLSTEAQKEVTIATSDAAKSWLERMSDRALLAGLKTQREQLEAMVSAGKLVFSPEDLARARKFADTVDRAQHRPDAGADYIKSLKERIALLGKETEYEQLLARIQAGSLKFSGEASKTLALEKAKELDLAQQQIEAERVLKGLRDQQATTQMQYMRELESFGEGENVRALNADLAKVEDQYRRLIEARRNSAQGLSDTELAQIRESLQQELDMVRWYHDEKLKVQQDWRLGALDAVRNYVDESKNLYAQVENAVTRSIKSMEDALQDFVTTGKLDFKSLADSIIKDMIRIAIQQSVTGPLARAFGVWLGGTGGASARAGHSLGGGLSLATFSSGGYTGGGGKFEPAGIVHRGEGVLNQAEIRTIGGEAGFNALRRAIRGQGHATGGMAGSASLPLPVRHGVASSVNVTVNVSDAGVQTNAPSGWEVFGQQVGELIKQKVDEGLMKSHRQGGIAWQARQGAFA